MKLSKKPFLPVAILFLILCVISGCATSSDSRLEPQSTLKFSDLPIPVGMKALPQESYSFENAGVRAAVLRYQGKGDIEKVLSFYKEQMPMYNWNLINAIEYGQRLLNFEREGESCIITLQTVGLWNEGVLVTISLGPKSQTAIKKKERAPLK
ncbi:MAG: hypothetical protein WC432_05850 [Candidatus Omnitrophota bacterium]|jgi:hypothetical protein